MYNPKERVLLTTYTAGAIEHVTKKEMATWREEIAQKLNSPDLLIYDPVRQESSKVGKGSGEQVEYIKGLKKAGRFDLVYNEMWKIWFGQISQNTDIIQLLTNLRMRKHIEGNTLEDLKYWGDAEAVVRSDFLIIYMPKDTKTVGTIWEQVFAMLFRIPIYLILPDAPKTEANTTLLFGDQISNNGELITFYSVNECVKYIKEKYNLKVIEKEKKYMSGKIRKFKTGATRDTNEGKYDYEGFLSPLVIERFGQYMNKHRKQSDGSLRDSDNWQKGFGDNHFAVCMKSLWRHFFDLWLEHRGYKSREGIEDALMGILFNTMAYTYKLLKDKNDKNKVKK